MSKIGVTYEDVVKTVATIQGLQQYPSVDRVREVLGTGSKSTIARHLRNWKNQENKTGPQGTPPEIYALVDGLWERLQAKSNTLLDEAKNEASEQVQIAEEKAHAALQENHQLQTRLHQTEENLFQEQEKTKNLSHQLTAATVEKSKLNERASLLEKQKEEQYSEAKRLHDLLQHMQKNLEHYQLAIQQLQQEQALMMEKTKNQYQQEITALRQQVAQENHEKHALHSELMMIQKQYQNLLQLYETQEVTLTALQQQLKENAITNATLQERYQQLNQAHDKLTVLLETKSQLLAEKEQNLAVTTHQREELKNSLQQAEDKIANLRHEQLFLVQDKVRLEEQLKKMQTEITQI